MSKTKPLDARTARRIETAQEQRTRTRAAILAATFQAIGHEHGRLAKIDDVARLAQIARPTFYTYFSSMEELFAALSNEARTEFQGKLDAQTATLKSPPERTAAAIRHHLARAQSDPQWGWSMVNLSISGPIFGVEVHARCRLAIQAGIDSGAFKLADADLGRDLLLGTLLAATKTILTSKVKKHYAAQITRHILLALGLTAAKADKLSSMALAPALTSLAA